MRILLACEESQAVCLKFRERGHEAFSADMLDCSGGYPEWHIKGDVLDIIKNDWDTLIAFPPCTHLAVCGARQQAGINFFMQMVNAPINRIAIENPIGIMSTKYRKPDQIIHPYYFGEPYSKSTCLWLKGLPKIEHQDPVEIIELDRGEFITFPSGKRMQKWCSEASRNGHLRSKTFNGIAEAMAEQWR